MNKQRQLEKLSLLKENPDLSLFDQMEALNGKLKAIEQAVREIEGKEVKTYEEEIKTLIEGITALQEALNGKDMVVNIPLDALSDKMVRVEQAIRAIKEVKIPEQPKEYPLPDLQINELLFSIQSLPDFPIDELGKMITGLGKKIEAIKLEIPERKEFDYGRLEKEFSKLTKAVKEISISVSGGGGGIGERANENLDDIKANTEGLATEDKQDPLSAYKITDIDDVGYYGFMTADGAWYIMSSVSGYRYIKGESDYATNWGNRASLSYLYYNQIF